MILRPLDNTTCIESLIDVNLISTNSLGTRHQQKIVRIRTIPATTVAARCVARNAPASTPETMTTILTNTTDPSTRLARHSHRSKERTVSFLSSFDSSPSIEVHLGRGGADLQRRV